MFSGLPESEMYYPVINQVNYCVYDVLQAVKQANVRTLTRFTSDWCCAIPSPPSETPRSAGPLTANTHPTLPYKKPTTPKNTGS